MAFVNGSLHVSTCRDLLFLSLYTCMFWLQRSCCFLHAVVTERDRQSLRLPLQGLGPAAKADFRARILLLESDLAIATATRDQHIPHNALLQSKHNWRSAVSNYTALRDIAAPIPHPSILQRLANRQLFVLDHSRRTQRWQPGSRHLRDPSHWSKQED
jgi:hypothetical protein